MVGPRDKEEVGEVIWFFLSRQHEISLVLENRGELTSSNAHATSFLSIRYICGTTWTGMLISLSLRTKPIWWDESGVGVKSAWRAGSFDFWSR